MPVLWLIVLFIVASFGIGFVFAHAGAILLILLFLRFVWWVLTDSPDE